MSDSTRLRTDGFGAKALTFALIGGVVLLLLPYASGLIGAGVLYVVAMPVVRRLDPSRRHKWAPLATVILLFFVLVLPGVWVMAQLLGQVPDAARLLQESPVIQRLMAMRIGEIDVGQHLREATSEIVAWSSRKTVTALGSLIDVTLNLVIALFGAYYLLLSADAIWSHSMAVLPLHPRTAEALRVRFHRTTEAMLLGVVFTGAAQGAIVGVAIALMGLSHPLLWGVVTAIASVLPLFGAALVWFPAALLLASQQRYVAATVLAALGLIVVSNIDNALRLVVYRRVSEIHPMVTLVGAFAGVRAFGIAGILLGPLVLSYVIELVKVYREPDGPVLEAAA